MAGGTFAYVNTHYQAFYPALASHEITTEVPHEVYLAIRHGKESPPPRVFRFSNETISAGVETHKMEGVTLHVFNPAKTVAELLQVPAKARRGRGG